MLLDAIIEHWFVLCGGEHGDILRAVKGSGSLVANNRPLAFVLLLSVLPLLRV